jgi:hypothetical protein
MLTSNRAVISAEHPSNLSEPSITLDKSNVTSRHTRWLLRGRATVINRQR